MELSQISNERLKEAMLKSAAHQDVTSMPNFQHGWLSAIRFAKKVEKADHFCEQCGKLITMEEAQYDACGIPFCKKCFDKVFKQ